MSATAMLLALPVALAGAWYLINPNAATRLAEVEGRPANVARVRLRRLNGVLMLVAGLALYVVISRTMWLTDGEGRRPGRLLPLACLALVPLVAGMLALAYLDMRLTRRLKRRAADAIARGRGPTAAVAAVALAWMLAGCEPESQVPIAAQAPVRAQPQRSRPATSPATTTPAQGTPQDLPRITMQLGGEAFEMQIADEEQERSTGFMWRKELGRNEGMIFVFEEASWRSFWMENTPVALDLIFLSANARVLNVEAGVPYSRASIQSVGRCQYVIEIARGRAAELGVDRGDQLTLPDGLKAAE